MRDRLTQEFYDLPATAAAPLLLGKLLCRPVGGETLRMRITETECYSGEEDTACHAHKGKTERTKIMYERGGAAYIYLCYGIHSLLNIVTGREGFPEAVLIRAVEGCNGPGRLTKALGIDRTLNGESLVVSDRLWLEDDGTRFDYVSAKRIGIDYADEVYKNILWRFTATKNMR